MLDFPFNFNPTAGFEIKTNTSNESVPDDEYWFVIPQLVSGGTFYINDGAADSRTLPTKVTQTATSTSAVSYSVGASSVFIGQIGASSATTFGIGGSSTNLGSISAPVHIVAGPGETITSGTVSADKSISGYVYDKSDENKAPIKIEVKSGTNLRVTSGSQYLCIKFSKS